MASEPFLSEIKIFAFDFPPRGWASCAGQSMAINTNQALFSLLGTTYGGNGITTFVLPDLRGRVPMHQGSSFNLGQTGGEVGHTLIQTEMPSHNHFVNASTNTADQTYPGSNLWAGGAPGAGYHASSSGQMAAGSLSITGSSQPHDNMSPYLVLNICIALTGVFPSRN